MCNSDYDSPEFYNQTQHTATRDHNCSECRRVISKGEHYERTVGKWVGLLETFKTCAHCLIVQNWLIMQCGNCSHGGLSEEIEEHAIEYQQIFLYKYLLGIRRKWRKKDKTLMALPKKGPMLFDF